jgi:hypothetical protein
MLPVLLSLSGAAEPPPGVRLLEITTRPFLYLLSQRYGYAIETFSAIPTEVFDEWQSQGYEWVWFMGIWQLGPAGLDHDKTDPGLLKSYDQVLPGWTWDDIIGSPYSIVSYTLNTILGTPEQLAYLRDQLHSRGIKLMLDFVPNHSATDAPEISLNLNYYVRAPQGTSDPNRYMSNGIAYGCGQWCDPWTDVAQFNYMDKDFRASRISVLKYIASVADGARCDMSHLILNDAFWDYWQNELTSWGYTKLPTEFWQDATSAVKADYPDFVFMAESYGDVLQKLQDLGFDYTYDKDPLDRLRDNNVNDFKSLLWSYSDSFRVHLAHFTENHDEPRSVANFKGNAYAADAAAAALLTLPGLRFVNQEQWKGYANKIDVHLRRAYPEDPKDLVVNFYNHLFKVLDTDSLKKGEFSMQTISGSDTVLTWKWVSGAEHILVCVNFATGQSGGYIPCPDAPLTGDTIPVLDMIGDVTYNRDPQDMRDHGLFVLLDGYQTQIMKY